MSNLRAIPFSKASTNSLDTLSPSSLTSLSSSSTSSSILTPPEEPIITKKNILINNPNIINGINVSTSPLTPPDYTSFEKRSVTFNIPEDNKNFRNANNNKFIQPSYIQDDDDDFEMNIADDDDYDGSDADDADTLAEYVNSIDISANNEIHVSLLERDTEMRELFSINKDYFDGVKQFISDHDNNGATWQEFLNILFSKREEIFDKEWMKCIGDHLKENPLFLVKFKEIVGYFSYDDDDDDDVMDDDAVVNSDINNQFYKDNYYYQNNNFIDVTLIRDFPKILENFESSYPQFFINLKQTLDTNNNSNYFNSDDDDDDEQEEKTPYEEFKNILLKSRNEMTDIEWEEAIYNILNPWPRLIEQLEEIVAYEIADE